MKRRYIILFAWVLLFSTSCTDDNEHPQEENQGTVIFYTNAQSLLNCGDFEVDVYIDSMDVGSISKSYIGNNEIECSLSDSTLFVEKEEGSYSYEAKVNCGQFTTWKGSFEVKADSCTKIFLDINELDELTGSVVFYTNAQALLNCGDFNVDIYIDNKKQGSIKKPSINNNNIECSLTDSTLLIEKEQGIYNYEAIQNGGLSDTLRGSFEIKYDSCTKIYIDNNKLGKNLTGTWIEKYPEMWDNITDTLVFTNDYKVEKHFIFDGYNFSYCGDIVTFYKRGEKTRDFDIEFIDSNEFIIYTFLQHSISQESKDTYFIKID